MRFRFRSKFMLLSLLLGLLIGSTIPVFAVDNESYGIFEKLTVNVPGDQKYVPGEILVKFNPGISEEKIKNINAGLGAQVAYASPFAGFKIFKIPATKTVEEMVEIYSKNPNVEYAVPNAVTYAFMVPNDPGYEKYQWNFKNGAGAINLEPAWDISTGKTVKGDRIIVAVLDSGVAYEDYSTYKKAPDLANTNFISGYDFVNNDTHPNDDNSHGTHVAGTIAQNTNNNYGVAGVAYDCSIMPVKVLNKQGSGTLQQLIDGIYFATNNGADVISMSLGFPPGYYPGVELDNALEYAYQQGVTIVAAAGNDGKGTVSYPAAYNKCISVGATNSGGLRSDYSNYGEALDIVAPGGDEIDRDGDGYMDGILQNTFNPTTKNTRDFSFWYFSGTSMATPHVSGVASLLISRGASGPDEVRSAMQNTATDLGAVGLDEYYGYGLVNATAALEYISIPTSDTNAPVITNINADAGTNSATVIWDTDETSNSTVMYSTDKSNFEKRSNLTLVSFHNVELTGLVSTTTYYYEVLSSDASGNTAIDNNNTQYYSFTTLAENPENLIHIGSVQVTTSKRLAGKSTFVSATAVATILDRNNNPVEGATVSGYWSGATVDRDSAVTNETGKVTVYSDEVKYKTGTLNFIFTVNNVSDTIPWDGKNESGTGIYP